jgi:hypothetical protein
VSDEPQVEGALRAHAAFGRWIVVNCAGRCRCAVDRLTGEKWCRSRRDLGCVRRREACRLGRCLTRGDPGSSTSLGERTTAGRGPGGLLCGEGRR